MRMIVQGCLAVLLGAGLSSAAGAAEDQARAVLSECSAPDLPDAAVDSCLERVRVLDETAPSPALQSLEARLDQQKSGRGTAAANGPPRPLQPLQEESVPESGMSPTRSAATAGGDALPSAVGGEDQSAPQTEPARSADSYPRDSRDDDRTPGAAQGSMGDDEPPVADPPDDAAPDGAADDPK